MFLLLLSFSSAVVDWNSDIIFYIPQYSINNGTIDLSPNGYDFGANGGVTFNGGSTAYDYDNTDDFLSGGDLSDFDSLTAMTVCSWAKVDNTANEKNFVSKWGTSGNDRSFYFAVTASENLLFGLSTDGSSQSCFEQTVNTIDTSFTHHYCVVYNNSATGNDKIKFFKDAVEDSSGSLSGTCGAIDANAGLVHIGAKQFNPTGYFFSGENSDTVVFNRALSDGEISSLYGEGQNYDPYLTVYNFSVTAKDFWNDSSINSFWAYIDGTNYTTTNGTITTTLLQNDSNTYNLSVGATDYFNILYPNIAVTSDYIARPHQAEIDFDSFELITNETLSSCNYTIDGQQNTTFYLNAQNHTVLSECAGYYPLNYTFSVSPLDILTQNVTGVYSSIVTVNLKDIITTDLIAKTSFVNVYNATTGYNETFNNTNGTVVFNSIFDNFTLTMWADDYAFRYVNVTFDDAVETFNYNLYSYNSVWVTAVDFNTGASLNNFSAEIYDANNTYSDNDNNTGTIRINNITSGVYTLRVAKDGYASAEYALTITGGSHQNVIAYLVASGSDTIFTVVNSISGAIIEGASANMYKTINSTWTLVSSQETDITGRVQFSYIPYIEYKFVIDATGYEQRTFFLQPLFDTYTIRLTPDVDSEPDLNVGDWMYEINNSGLFYNNQINNFSISISSGTGTIEYYYLNVTHPNGTIFNVSCSNSYGCSDDFSLNLSVVSYNASVVVDWIIKETGRSAKYFKKVYLVRDVYGTGTLMNWTDNDDMGDLEKVTIATIIILVIVGVFATASYLLGVPVITVSGIVLAVLIEVLAHVGFVADPIAHFVALGCLLIVLFGRGQI